jgi:ABC-type uncharacterized transport system permease subunit
MTAIVLGRLQGFDRRVLLRWVLAIVGAAAVFGLLVLTKGANPFEVYRSMFESVRGSSSMEGILLKATPLILAALAVAVPARAGMVNVGGEGQLVMGGVFASPPPSGAPSGPPSGRCSSCSSASTRP